MQPPQTPATDEPVGVLVAVREEAAAVCGRMSPVVVSGGVRDAFEGRISGQAVVVARSGMGALRSRRAAEALIREHRVRAIVVAGFAGGLSDEQAAGDLVIATAAIDGTAPGRDQLAPDAAWLARARGASVGCRHCHEGAVVSAPDMVHAPEAKRRVRACWPGALAVDMETAAAAAVASAAGVPWLAVRAITDSAAQFLPDFTGSIDEASGEVSRWRLAVRTLARPGNIPALVSLGRRASRAAGNLAAFIELLLRPSEG